MNNDIEKITVYASKYNIEKIKTNNINYLEKRKLYNETISSYEQRIIELETENRQLNDRIYNLQEQIDNYQNVN